jgi:hypothetical protein
LFCYTNFVLKTMSIKKAENFSSYFLQWPVTTSEQPLREKNLIHFEKKLKLPSKQPGFLG